MIRGPSSPAVASAPGEAQDFRQELEAAIGRTQELLLGLQREEGYWEGELMVDATPVSDMVLFHHWNRKVDPRWQEKAASHILSRQLPEGGWNIYINGPCEVNATIKAYLALKLAGLPAEDPRMERARKVARRLGGVPRMNTFSKLYLALLGLYPWSRLPTVPCEAILLGRWCPVNISEMSSWTRSMLVPISIINHFRPTRRPDPGFSLGELYPEGFQERDLALPRDPQWLSWRNGFLLLDRLLKGAEWLAQRGLHPLRRRALRRSEQWMLERFEGSDGLASIFPAMLNSLIALKALGYADDHFQVVRAERTLRDLEREEGGSLWIEPCLSPVWDTAIACFSLRQSGLPEDHPALDRAALWLMDQEVRFRGDWHAKNPVDVEPSGWVFEHNNKWNPDLDDTSMVLIALRQTPTSQPLRRDECYRRGLAWLLAFQCRNGGWAAFDKDCTRRILEKVPFADHNAMLDPECADITARVLELLGMEGYTRSDPQVERAVGFLRRTQEEDGSWYGRWGVNYIYGTWQALRGLRSVGLDMEEEWLQRSRSWLLEAQNPDGGWGERCDTYRDPSLKGQGPSTASQTAWALMALCAFGESRCAGLERGAGFLLRTQNPDGAWTEEETTGTGFPNVFYLKYDMYRISWPLLALSMYRDLRGREGWGAGER